MEKKQSSVELFAIALYEKGFLKGNGDEINYLLQQAKAMHKEEIVESHHEGYYSFSHSGEQYYNETFGGSE